MQILTRQPFDIIKAVVFALVLREARGRFSKNRLGAFWFVFEPLCHVAVLIVLFTVVRGRTLPGMDFPLFLVAGIAPFLLFRNIALKGMEAVSANQGLFSYRQIKPFDCIVARTIVEFSMMACVYVTLIFVLSFWGKTESIMHEPLRWLGALAVGVVLSFALALIFCIVVDAFPEVKSFIRLMFLPLYLLSGVIIPIWRLPPQFLDFMTWNPYFHIIDTLRRTTFPSYPNVSVVDEKYPAEVAFVLLFIGVALYRARRLKLVAR